LNDAICVKAVECSNKVVSLKPHHIQSMISFKVLQEMFLVNRPPGCITLDDVRTAILTRPEFDLFSNRGLGVQLADTG
jgi:hypothetical protein